MSEQWICYKFPSLKHAMSFTSDVVEGYRTQGIDYVRSWERPKRKKGGYWIAVCTSKPERFDALAGYHGGQRLTPTKRIGARRRQAAGNT